MKENFQKSRWDKFFLEDIYTLFKEFKYDYNGISVRLKPNLAHVKNISDSPDKSKKSLAQPLYVDLKITYDNKNTELSEVEYNDFKIADIPVFTDQGFLKDGSLKRVISVEEPASGWYIYEKNLAAYRNDFNVYFRLTDEYVLHREKESFKTDIFTFLKACTGLSFKELQD